MEAKQGVNFNTPSAMYWSNITKAEYLQRRIIVYSIAYYELSDTIVDDVVYERISKQYLDMVEEMSLDELRRTQYWYVFEDYDGSTGFHLYSALDEYDREYLTGITKNVLKTKPSGSGKDAKKR